MLDKPPGLSSNAALQRVKQLYRAAKAGHTGALDPLATGLLPVCLGQATKLSGHLLDADKRYRARATVGFCTTTGDAEGAPTQRSDPAALTREAVVAALPAFTGTIRQRPPMYSALKRDGQPLYRLARQGIEVEREARDVQISALTLTGFGPGWFELDVCCSKGTYIRTLVEDLAAAAGACAHVAALRRLEAGPFVEADMVTLDAVAAAAAQGDTALDTLLRPPRAGLAGWAEVAVSADGAAALSQGRPVRADTGVPAGPVAVVDAAGALLGIAEADAEGWLRPRRWMA